MPQIQDNVCIAAGMHHSFAVRQQAFGEIVTQFQDMAFACAYAILGDAYLAEDVAQESFVIAWQKIEQLRTAAAFPGWFKRIVLSQCNRLTRSHRLQIVPLEITTNHRVEPFAQRAVEQRELMAKVLKAIEDLPENERLVTTLFYVNEYSQADIGEFLELPVSTVNKRIYSARQRLKGKLVELFKDDLQRQRPSQNAEFTNTVKAKVRLLTTTDWSIVSSMARSREASDTAGNEHWLRRREKFDESRYLRRQYVAETRKAKIIGYGAIEQSIYLPRYRLVLVVNPDLLNRGVGDLLLDQLTKDLLEAGAITVTCREYSSQGQLISFLKARGFVETTNVMDSRLELGEAELNAWQEQGNAVKSQGISITTLADQRVRDPECVRKLYELSCILAKDDPARGLLSPPAFDPKEATMWLEMPYILPHAYFIAMKGDHYIGVTELSLYDAMPGCLTQGIVGVLQDYRRRGIGRALLSSAIDYAQRNKYQTIQAFNNRAQTTLRALNERVGFRPYFEHLTLEKCLIDSVAVNPSIYDGLCGRYRASENDQVLEITVRNESGHLSAECHGQKVELFPKSETEYFIKQFYGEVSFIRENGHGETLLLKQPRDNPAKTIQARRVS